MVLVLTFAGLWLLRRHLPPRRGIEAAVSVAAPTGGGK
jgi:hypothetical protein